MHFLISGFYQVLVYSRMGNSCIMSSWTRLLIRLGPVENLKKVMFVCLFCVCWCLTSAQHFFSHMQTVSTWGRYSAASLWYHVADTLHATTPSHIISWHRADQPQFVALTFFAVRVSKQCFNVMHGRFKANIRSCTYIVFVKNIKIY